MSAAPSQGRCDESGGSVTCHLGAMASGGSATAIIVVAPESEGILLNTARVASDVADPNVANNSATANTTVNLSVSGPTFTPTATPMLEPSPTPTLTPTSTPTLTPTATPSPAAEWTDPVDVCNLMGISVNEGCGALEPEVVVGASGRPHIVFNWPKYGQVRYNSPALSGEWGPAENVPRLGVSESPDNAVDSQGTVHMVWRNGNDPEEVDGYGLDIVYAFRTKDGSWSTPVKVAPANNASQSSPRITVDSDDTVHLVFDQRASGFSSVWEVIYVLKPSGGDWSSPEVATLTTAQDSQFPDIAVDSDSTPHVVFRWNQEKTAYTFRGSNGWTAPLALSGAASTARRPFITTGPDDGLHVAWEGRGNLLYVTRGARYQDPWTSPAIFSQGLEGGTGDPSLVVDSKSTVHVVWRAWVEFPSGTADVFYAFKNANSAEWSMPVNLTDSPADSLDPAIGVDSSDFLHLVFEQRVRRDGREIWYITTNAGAEETPTPAPTPTSTAVSPSAGGVTPSAGMMAGVLGLAMVLIAWGVYILRQSKPR